MTQAKWLLSSFLMMCPTLRVPIPKDIFLTPTVSF